MKIMKAITKYLMMMIAMLAMTVSFSSCGGDDDVTDTDKYDFYIECNVSGGGLDSSETNYLQSQLNSSLSEVRWEMLTKEDAIYYFDKEMKDLKYSFSDGLSYVDGTLYLKFILKTVDGKTVKTTTLNVTKDGCTFS